MMRRNTYTREFKQQVVKKAIETVNCSIAASRYDINPIVLARAVRLERECFSLNEFRFYSKAYGTVAEFVKFYNSMRIHVSVYWMSPEEYYKGVRDNTVIAIEITADKSAIVHKI